jgi:hypothetical protein
VFNCRLDQVASGLVQLLVVDFVVSKILSLIMPQLDRLKSAVLKSKTSKTEFLVAQKMVSLLYSQGLFFLSIPYTPLFSIVILIFHFLTFKFEKMMLFKYGTKPKKEWKAQDAGGFFIKFYLITIVITGFVSVVLFVTGNTFAKEYDILLEILEDCPKDDDSSDHSPGCTTLNSTEIELESKGMCGPFTNVTSAWNMVTEDVVEASTLTKIFYQIGVNVVIVWFIVMYFYLQYRFTESTLGVSISSIQERSLAFEGATAANESKIRRLVKENAKLKMVNQAQAES